MRQIPGAHVVTWISQDLQRVKVSRGKVHPALVCEYAAWNVVEAEVLQPVGPPIGEAAPLGASADAQKTLDCIRHAATPRVHYPQLPPGCFSGSVRCGVSTTAECSQAFQQRLKRVKNNDVRIEIQNYVAILPAPKAAGERNPSPRCTSPRRNAERSTVWRFRIPSSSMRIRDIERLIPQVEIQGWPIGESPGEKRNPADAALRCAASTRALGK